MKYKQRITAVIFLMLVIPVGLRCVAGPKNFYWSIGWHLSKVDILYASNHIAAVQSGVESTIYEKITWQDMWIESYGGIQYLLDKNYIKGSLALKPQLRDTVMRLDNHYLTFADSGEFYPEVASRVIRFHEFLTRKNIPFLYVQAPGKVCKTDPHLLRGMDDCTNRKADTLLKELNAAKVATFDLRDEFPHGGSDYYSLFFIGDNHWNTPGAFLAAQKTTAFINDRFDVKLDAEALLPERFSREDFHFRFTGSQRDRIGNSYTPPDSNTLLLPVFPTEFDVTQKGKIVTTGSFEDIWVDRDSLADGKSCYSLYVRRYSALANFTNKNTHSTARILLVGDSFSILFAPFLALSSKEYMYLDFGYLGSIKEVVESYQPDLVIFLYCPNLRKDILEVDYGDDSDNR